MRLGRLACLFALALLAACASAPGAPPTPGDCMTIRLWSNGWHANLALPAEAFEEGHPLRSLFPDSRYFLIGWGERDFYMATKAGFWKGLKAIIPPSPSVVQVIAADAPVEETLWPGRDLVEFAISRSGVKRMAEGIANSLAYDAEGEPIILGEGRVAGASYFLAAKGNFYLFNMCNHWTARRLREAGVRVRGIVSFTAPGLMRAVRRKAPAYCPVSG
jgi:uncharacterized protein (TIGR02117 family)